MLLWQGFTNVLNEFIDFVFSYIWLTRLQDIHCVGY